MQKFIRRLLKNNGKTAHFSVDDTIWLFENLDHFQFESIFEQPTLAFFKELHDIYGLTVSFFCFESFNGLNLADMPKTYRREFEANRAWMRFGFHGASDKIRYSEVDQETAKNDYLRITEMLKTITGEKSLDSIPRLHCWSGNRRNLCAMSRYGLKGVLCAERFDAGYDLTLLEKLWLHFFGMYKDRKNSISFISTEFRVKNTPDISSVLSASKHKHMEIFTHEWELNETEKEKIRNLCDLLRKDGYTWTFAEELEV